MSSIQFGPYLSTEKKNVGILANQNELQKTKQSIADQQ
jgi:hypothetical protein